MSHSSDGNDTFTSPVPIPDLLDVDYPTSVADGMQAAADRTKFHENTLQGGFVSDTLPGVVAGSVLDMAIPPLGRANFLRTIASKLMQNISYVAAAGWGTKGVSQGLMAVQLSPVVESDGGATQLVPGTYFQPSAASDKIAWTQVTTSPSTSPRLWIPIHGLPPTGKLTYFKFRCKGGSGHTGTLPGTMPKLTLLKRDSTVASVASVIYTKTDPAATAGEYETEREITAPGVFTETIAVDTLYYFRWEGESGTNKQTGLQLLSITIGIDPT
jgi:hypothetical protein